MSKPFSEERASERLLRHQEHQPESVAIISELVTRLGYTLANGECHVSPRMPDCDCSWCNDKRATERAQAWLGGGR